MNDEGSSITGGLQFWIEGFVDMHYMTLSWNRGSSRETLTEL